jgi:Ni/Fe-hydrogenase subunit HybB-like protein
LLAIGSGSYTAWLFAQAKARDLWQSPILPLQHLVACVLAGASALVIASGFAAPALAPLLTTIAAAATGLHLLLIAAEVLTPHPTAHARLAVREMVRGRYRIEFAAGVILQLLGLASMTFRAEAAVLMLLGLLLYEHAHVGAGQAVPLA